MSAFQNILDKGFGVDLGVRDFVDDAYILSKSDADRLNGNGGNLPQDIHPYKLQKAIVSISDEQSFRCISQPRVKEQQSEFLKAFHSPDQSSLETVIVGNYREDEQQEILNSEFQLIGIGTPRKEFDGNVKNLKLRETHSRPNRKKSKTVKGNYSTALCKGQRACLLEYWPKDWDLEHVVLMRVGTNIMGRMAEKIDWLYEECDGFTGSREEIFGYFRDQCIERGEIEKSKEMDYSINQMKYEKSGVFVCKNMYFDESQNVYVIEFFDAKYDLTRNGTWVSYIRGILRKVCALMEYLPHFIIIPLHPVRDPGVVFLKTKKGKIVSFKAKIACAGHTWLCDAKPMLWGYDDNDNFVCFGEWDRSNDELVCSSGLDFDSDFEIEDDDSYTIELDEMDESDYEEENKNEVEEHDEMEEDISTLQTGNLPLSPIPIPQCNVRQGVVARGLRNLGNSCYLNASLQVLFSLPDFLQDLDELCSDIKSKSMDASAASSIPICSAIVSIGKELGLISDLPGIESTGSSYADPSILKNEIDKKCLNFRGYQQHDAEEFMSRLIAILHKELLDATKNIGIEEKSLPTSTFFQIVIELSRKCDSCGSLGTSHETFTHLALEVHDRDMSDNEWNIKKSLAQYFSTEKIEDFHCEECSTSTSCTRCTTIVSRPKALLVQLKRFAYNDQMQKRSEKVAPTKDISLEKFVDEKLADETESSFTYGLTGVVFHKGNTPNSGHYTANALRTSTNSQEKVWVNFNDEKTAKSSIEDVNSDTSQSENYLLLYCTKDDLTQV